MFPLQAPIIPDAGTLDRLAGRDGGLVAMAIGLSLALGAIVWLVRRAFKREEDFALAKDEHSKQVLAQHRDYTEKLLAQKDEYITKLQAFGEQTLKANLEDAANQRELIRQMERIEASVKTLVRPA